MENLTKQEFEAIQIAIHTGKIVPKISLNNQCASCSFDKDSFGCKVVRNRIEDIRPGYCGKYINFSKYENDEDVNYDDHFYELKTCKKRILNTGKPIN